jgi:hypothetical protein
MNTPLQVANAFAVNDAHLKNPPLAAFGKIRRDQLADVFGSKRVQIEHAVDGQPRRFVIWVKHIE